MRCRNCDSSCARHTAMVVIDLCNAQGPILHVGMHAHGTNAPLMQAGSAVSPAGGRR